MNRDLKFRAWNEQDGMCLPWTLTEVLDKAVTGKFDSVPEGTVFMQYTGLKDKNGREIYESDVVRIANMTEDWKHDEPDLDWRIFKIEWNRYTWAFNNAVIYFPLSDYNLRDGTPYDIEVIGNIYENPDLLPS